MSMDIMDWYAQGVISYHINGEMIFHGTWRVLDMVQISKKDLIV